jgi:hypothetical protein
MGISASSRSWLSGKFGWPGAILIGSLLLLWPPLLNGQPFLMQDTTAYIRGADAAYYQLTGEQSDWTTTFLDRFGDAEERADFTAPSAAPQTNGESTESLRASNAPVVLTGRSIYYGIILRLSWALGSLWWAAIFQALLVSTCVALTYKRIYTLVDGDPRAPAIVAILGALTLVTPLAYFTGYLVPDVFSSLAILGAAQIFAFRDALSKRELFFWIAVMSFAALCHNSAIAMLAVITVAFVAARLLIERVLDWRSAVLVSAAVLAGLAGNQAFSLAVEQATGHPPISPPFVAARLIADGPGLDYLKSTCPRSGFYLCNFTDASKDSATFIWAERRPEGAFKALDPWQQRVIAGEQGAFVLAVVTDRPLSVVVSSAQSFLKQITNFRMPYFNYRPGLRSYFSRKLPEKLFIDLENTRAYRNAMPERSIELTTVVFSILSIIVIFAWSGSARGFNVAGVSRMRTWALAVVFGVVSNDLVCGALSSPAARYHLRVIWLIPFVAFCILGVWRRPKVSQSERSANADMADATGHVQSTAQSVATTDATRQASLEVAYSAHVCRLANS